MIRENDPPAGAASRAGTQKPFGEKRAMEGRLNHAVRHRRGGQKGFTLIELLVVIAVLAILAAIVLFNVVGVSNRGQSAACNTDVKTLQTAVDAYLNDGNTVASLTGAAQGDWVVVLVGKNYLHPMTSTNASSKQGTSCTNTLTLTQSGPGLDVAGS